MTQTTVGMDDLIPLPSETVTVINVRNTPSSGPKANFGHIKSKSQPNIQPSKGSVSSPSRLSVGMLSSFIPLKHFSINSASQQKYPVHDKCAILDCVDLKTLLVDNRDVLVIDVRCYMEYSKAHIKGAINVSLPSTLLKRKNFDLVKLLKNLPESERIQIQHKLEGRTVQGIPSIIIYDQLPISPNGSTSLACFGICSKFLEHDWGSSEFKRPGVSILNEGFLQFQLQYPALVESTTLDEYKEQLAECNKLDTLLSCSSPLSSSNVSPVDSDDSSSKISLQLTKFQLPRRQTRLSIGSTQSFSSFHFRHPEESNNLESYLVAVDMSESSKCSSHEEDDYEPSTSSSKDIYSSPLKLRFQVGFEKLLTMHQRDLINMKIPQWFQELMLECSKLQFVEQFQRLDLMERARLDRLFVISPTSCPDSLSVELNDNELNFETDYNPTISVSCGLELGTKNRYKGIIPYEHTRVVLKKDLAIKVNEVSFDEQSLVETYINANYLTGPFTDIRTPGESLRYIATQAPLSETIHDFYTCIINNNVPLVLTLTDQYECGIEKCSNFWDSSIHNGIKVELMETDRLDDLYLRRIKLTYNQGKSTHTFLQVQITGWPDLGILTHPSYIIYMISIKNYLLDRLIKRGFYSNDHPPTILVHCSAGCGRTGTLCTVDTILSNLESIDEVYGQALVSGATSKNPFDPVVLTIDRFRKQRMSMVQTINQFLFVYDCLLLYFTQQLDVDSQGRSSWQTFMSSLDRLDILKNFLCNATVN
ncbi:HCL179Wp [Eremothecium sinecaudum]|uniref:protein-tyrosine-phosphatase n=1 Tax=Eremothecium sinecaudum TaxID=45286 RepID=A0A0X8HR84_9SACH|nr:HCL179Wp [Eremothecium sinecaudum]AMD19972.1 HCL179Wp [Eremothecium sinecaudum]